MASSRGRERMRQNAGRTFVFGSSTPRDLSHMNKIPVKLRSYDARHKQRQTGPPLREFMEKARSLTREEPTGGRTWVFGSSTPRDFSHLTKIDPKFRRYDAALPKKSVTSPEICTPTRRSITAPPVNRTPIKPPQVNTGLKKQKDDDISSEPDFVQDREEFIKDIQRLHKISVEQDVNSNTKRMSIGEANEDHVAYTQAVELAHEVVNPERVPHNIQDDHEIRAKQEQLHELGESIVLTELEDSLEEIRVDEKRENYPVADELLQKVEQTYNDINPPKEEVELEQETEPVQ